MRLTILAIGRAAKGHEQALTAEYLARINAMGRGVALSAALAELEPKGGRAGESAALLARLAPGARLIALDERGEQPSSAEFAARIGRWRDAGAPEAAFCIGGADGHDEALRLRADWRIAFGRMTLPHMLARAVLAEQLYRAATILAGHPYHRE